MPRGPRAWRAAGADDRPRRAAGARRRPREPARGRAGDGRSSVDRALEGDRDAAIGRLRPRSRLALGGELLIGEAPEGLPQLLGEVVVHVELERLLVAVAVRVDRLLLDDDDDLLELLAVDLRALLVEPGRDRRVAQGLGEALVALADAVERGRRPLRVAESHRVDEDGLGLLEEGRLLVEGLLEAARLLGQLHALEVAEDGLALEVARVRRGVGRQAPPRPLAAIEGDGALERLLGASLLPGLDELFALPLERLDHIGARGVLPGEVGEGAGRRLVLPAVGEHDPDAEGDLARVLAILVAPRVLAVRGDRARGVAEVLLQQPRVVERVGGLRILRVLVGEHGVEARHLVPERGRLVELAGVPRRL